MDADRERLVARREVAQQAVARVRRGLDDGREQVLGDVARDAPDDGGRVREEDALDGRAERRVAGDGGALREEPELALGEISAPTLAELEAEVHWLTGAPVRGASRGVFGLQLSPERLRYTGCAEAVSFLFDRSLS